MLVGISAVKSASEKFCEIWPKRAAPAMALAGSLILKTRSWYSPDALPASFCFSANHSSKRLSDLAASALVLSVPSPKFRPSRELDRRNFS
jgi:hypothetical protein